MTLLLDTQVALWWLVGAKRLSERWRKRIAASTCVVSVASLWEVSIKHRLGKLPVSPERFRNEMVRGGTTISPVHEEHAIVSGALAIDHSDPFDRLLVATAIVEGWRFATADSGLIECAEVDPSLPILEV